MLDAYHSHQETYSELASANGISFPIPVSENMLDFALEYDDRVGSFGDFVIELQVIPHVCFHTSHLILIAIIIA